MKLVREDYFDNPSDDWICRGSTGNDISLHIWETIEISKRFFIMKCINCKLIDPCGVPLEYIDEKIL